MILIKCKRVYLLSLYRYVQLVLFIDHTFARIVQKLSSMHGNPSPLNIFDLYEDHGNDQVILHREVPVSLIFINCKYMWRGYAGILNQTETMRLEF